MKNIYLLGFIIGLMSFTSCQKDELEKPTPSPQPPAGTQGVFFPAANKSAFELMPVDPTEFELTIARSVSSGAVEVPINVEVNDDDVFVVPSSVSFAEGETEKTFKVTFPSALEGKTYNLKLNVEGDDYINPYVAGFPYVKTNATRVKWEPVKEPMVYVDGTFGTIFGVSFLPMYVNAEKAVLGSVTRYRFKNAYKVPTADEPDADGIYDGYPYNDPGDFDENNDFYTIVEIGGDKGKANDVFMASNDIGVVWGDGMISIGSVYSNVSKDAVKYPLGTLKDSVITFPENSLYISMVDFNDGSKYPAPNPTYIYLSKNVYIAANLKIDSFNDVEYEENAVEEGTFKSAATSDDTWNQTMLKAIDVDEDNPESEYKRLFYLPNLYEEDFGLAFYYSDSTKMRIPDNQPTGLKVFGKNVYVSMSDDIKSGYIIGSEEEFDEELKEGDKGYNPDAGTDRYIFGLKFHFKDGTSLGEFAEKLLLEEDDISPVIGSRKSSAHRFEIQGKVSPKELKRNVQETILF